MSSGMDEETLKKGSGYMIPKHVAFAPALRRAMREWRLNLKGANAFPSIKAYHENRAYLYMLYVDFRIFLCYKHFFWKGRAG